MSTDTLHIEAFHSQLHGARILCHGGFTADQMPPLYESIQPLRTPFKRRILVTGSPLSLCTLLPLPYDAQFHVKDNHDWTMVLTYMTYVVKPLLLVVENLAIPDAIWQKLQRTTTVIHMAPVRTPVTLKSYDVIFFPPMETMTREETEWMYTALQTVYRPTYSAKEHKEVLHEIRVAKAGMCWSRMDEEAQGGALYWYDPVAQQGDAVSREQLSKVCEWMAVQLKGS